MDKTILLFIYITGAISSIIGLIISIYAFSTNNINTGYAFLFLTIFGLIGAIFGIIIGGFIGLVYVSIKKCLNSNVS